MMMRMDYSSCWIGWSLLILTTSTSAFASNESMTSNSTIGVGFGTAGLGHECFRVVQMALKAGFRQFDTAEADWWYDQAAVGRALQDYFENEKSQMSCQEEDLRISTKIPPWSLTSLVDIRGQAARSRQELVGFCRNEILVDAQENHNDHEATERPFPLDVYYIHAPECWKGWHPKCDNPPPILNLREAWLAMEAVVADGSARRIGLSNVHPHQLLDIIQFVQERQKTSDNSNGVRPRMPDVVQAFADPVQPAHELQRICQEYFIEFVSYSTLGTQHLHKTHNVNPVLTHPIVVSLAQQYQRSVAEVVLSWALQHNMSVIPRSRNQQHIQELARLLQNPSGFLNANDLEQMDSLQNSI